MTEPDRDAAEQALEAIEARVVAGQQALAKRNAMLADLARDGWRQAEMTRVLNRARARRGAEPLSPDAVFAALRRQRQSESLAP